MFKHVIVSVRRKVCWHFHWQPLKIILKNYVLLGINLVGLAIGNYRLLNKLQHFLSLNSIHYFVDSRICKSLRVFLLCLERLLKRSIFNKERLRFKSIYKLLSKLYALFAVMFAAKYDNHLFSLLVLHYYDAVLKIKIHHDVFGRLKVKSKHSLL